MPSSALRLKSCSLARVVLPRFVGQKRISTFDDVPIEEFLDKHVARDKAPPLDKGITSTRREVLSLYREVWRVTRAFTWTNDQCVLWKDVLRLSARREFEAARFERDPETIAKLLFMGRGAVRSALEKVSTWTPIARLLSMYRNRVICQVIPGYLVILEIHLVFEQFVEKRDELVFKGDADRKPKV